MKVSSGFYQAGRNLQVEKPTAEMSCRHWAETAFENGKEARDWNYCCVNRGGLE